MKKVVLICGLILSTLVGSAQPTFRNYTHDLSYFIPKTLTLTGKSVTLDGNYDKSIPAPKDVLGFELGSQHCEWGDVLRYMDALNRASDRVQLRELGRTHEHRPMIQLIISSSKNLAKLEQIKADHLKLSNPKESASLNVEQMPLVSDVVCSIHGNEDSGVNASLALAYLFAASQDAPILEMLDNMVLLLMPGANPDGINNFSVWCNHTRSENMLEDKLLNSVHEPWPRNRGNHYWQNLNRDLLMCQHPEGRVCVSHYLEWLPNLVLDLHEKTGKAGTFFHSPGHPKRLHPYVTQENQALTKVVGDNITSATTPIGARPYSGQQFDDFYLGKSAAYGDVHGSVCLLFEHPNTGQYARLYDKGVLTLAQGIRTQTYATLSALMAGCNMRTKLLNYQREHYQKAAAAANENTVKGFVFHANGDRARAYRLLENLLVHQVKVYHLAKDVKVGKEKFVAGESFIIPLSEQPYYYKTMALWEKLNKDTSYESKIFYDISTWTFPLAYNVTHGDLKSVDGLVGAVAELKFAQGSVIGGKSKVAYTFAATELYSHNILRALMQNGVAVKIGSKPFKAEGQKMGYGSAVVEVANQPINADKLYEVLAEAAKENGVDVYAINNERFATDKLELVNARQPKVAMLVGDGIEGSNCGEVWMLLDKHYGIAPTMISRFPFDSKLLAKHNTLIVVDGSLPKGHKEFGKIRKWVENGGTLITVKEGYKFANFAGLTHIATKEDPSKSGENKLKGAILNASLDTTSPLGWGYNDENLPLMKVGNKVLETPKSESTIVPLCFTKEPYLSGYISQENLDRVVSAPAAMVIKCGKGRVIHFAESITFRSYWYGSSKLMMNAIYFGHLY